MLVRADNIKFKDQVFTKTCRDMQAIASPLKKYGIEHFSYQVCHGNNVFELLTTHAAFSQLFIDRKFYQTAFSGEPSEYIDGFVLGQDIEHPELLEALEQSEGIVNGIIIVKTLEGRAELFYFGSTAASQVTQSFYVNNLNLLKQFIKYFKETAGEILKQSSNNRLLYPNSDDKTVLTSQEWRQKNFQWNQFYKAWDEWQYQTIKQPPTSSLSFTPREIEVIELLKTGLSMKEIARLLSLSPRTIEKFIDRVKKKLCCKTTTQLLCCLLDGYSV